MDSAAHKKQAFVDSGQYLRLPDLDADLYFRRSGSGTCLLLALHGFGLDGSIFGNIASQIDPSTHTLIAPDLPGHGKTNWSARAFTAQDLVEVVSVLKDMQSIDSVHLIGFSYGGRIFTKLVSNGWISQTRELTLMAPDGYGGEYTRWIDSWLGFSLKGVAALVAYPKPWLWLARILARTKIINPFALQFVEWQLGDPKSRSRLQLTLRSMGQFRLKKSDYQALNRWAGSENRASVWLGQRDKVVHAKRMEEIVGTMPNVQWHLHTGGHWPTAEMVKEGFY
ncbi:MAG: alpha/beta fold hydrolase [Bacteroidota bacterium]